MFGMDAGQEFMQTYIVKKEVYETFISVFKDKNPLHISDTFAHEFSFKEKVMHGNILNGFLSHFIGECLPIKNVIIHSQSINFKHPVYQDDSLSLSATISDVHESVKAVEFKFRFSNNRSQKVATGRFQIGILEKS